MKNTDIQTMLQQYFQDAQAHYGEYALVAGLLWIFATNFKLPKLFVMPAGLYLFWKHRTAIEAKYGGQK